MSIAEFSFTDRVRPIVELGLGVAPVVVGVSNWDGSLWDGADTWFGLDQAPPNLEARWAKSYWGDDYPSDGLPSPADPGFPDAGDAHWSGFEPEWFDVTCDVINLELAVGRARTTDRFEVGTATLTLSNEEGRYDLHLPAPLPGALLSLVPGRAMRIGVEHAVLGQMWLWRGYIDDVIPSYDPVEHDVMRINGIDPVGEVGRVQLAALADPGVGASERSDARIKRILTAAAWWLPDGADIAPAATAMLATTLGDSAANLLSVTADSEGGAVFGDTVGRVAFRQRDWQTFTATDPPDALVGNVLPGMVCPTSIELAFRRGDIVTRAVVARETDNTPKVFENRNGIAMYGHETYEATDLICSDVNTLSILANRVLRTRNPDNEPRVEAVTFDAATGSDVVDLLTVTDPRTPSRWEMLLNPGNGAVVDDRQMFVTGMHHTMSRDEWVARYDLDLAWPYAVADEWRWQSSTGAADAGTWKHAQWVKAV